MGVKVAFFGAEGGIRNVAGIPSEGGNYIAVAFGFKGCGVRFKFHRKISVISRKGSRRGTKVDALVNGKIRFGVKIIFL